MAIDLDYADLIPLCYAEELAASLADTDALDILRAEAEDNRRSHDPSDSFHKAWDDFAGVCELAIAAHRNRAEPRGSVASALEYERTVDQYLTAMGV